MEAPTIQTVLSAGWRATARCAWLAPVGMFVGLARSALFFPVVAVAAWLMTKGATAAPRFLAMVGGLWLSGLLLGAALRVAYLAGALPTLGLELSGRGSPSPVFTSGMIWRFPRLAGTAILVFLFELAGSGFAVALVWGAFLISWHLPKSWTLPAVAAVVAMALTLAVSLPFALSAVGDAALARAALRDERPACAVASAWIRFARRPAAFLVVAMLVALVGFMVTGSLRIVSNLTAGFTAGRGVFLFVGPELMILALAAVLVAFVELWRLATLAILACGECDQ